MRRALLMAEAHALVECSGETYRLVPEFRCALDAELEATGIKASERLERRKYEREREAYRERIARWRLRKPDVWPRTFRSRMSISRTWSLSRWLRAPIQPLTRNRTRYLLRSGRLSTRVENLRLMP